MRLMKASGMEQAPSQGIDCKKARIAVSFWIFNFSIVFPQTEMESQITTNEFHTTSIHWTNLQIPPLYLNSTVLYILIEVHLCTVQSISDFPEVGRL